MESQPLTPRPGHGGVRNIGSDSGALILFTSPRSTEVGSALYPIAAMSLRFTVPFVNVTCPKVCPSLRSTPGYEAVSIPSRDPGKK
jgi:hypothetical protein